MPTQTQYAVPTATRTTPVSASLQTVPLNQSGNPSLSDSAGNAVPTQATRRRFNWLRSLLHSPAALPALYGMTAPPLLSLFRVHDPTAPWIYANLETPNAIVMWLYALLENSPTTPLTTVPHATALWLTVVVRLPAVLAFILGLCQEKKRGGCLTGAMFGLASGATLIISSIFQHDALPGTAALAQCIAVITLFGAVIGTLSTMLRQSALLLFRLNRP